MYNSQHVLSFINIVKAVKRIYNWSRSSSKWCTTFKM